MDIAGAQVAASARLGRLTRIDVRLAPGADRDALLARLALPAGVRAAAPGEATQRVSNVSRAYRVNLTVLALVALFTGAFLVFSVLSLSVAKRQQQLALLGVLGLGARERIALVLGRVGAARRRRQRARPRAGHCARRDGAAPASAATSAAATSPASRRALQLRCRRRRWSTACSASSPRWSAAGCRRATPRRSRRRRRSRAWAARRSSGARPGIGAALIGARRGLALLPPVAGMPLAAYASVACLLLGGIACVPAGVGLALRRHRRRRATPLALLAVERARHERDSATVAVAGVVASLALRWR